MGSQCELRAVRSLVTITYLGKPGVELPTVIFSKLITESEGESEGVGCKACEYWMCGQPGPL